MLQVPVTWLLLTSCMNWRSPYVLSSRSSRRRCWWLPSVGAATWRRRPSKTRSATWCEKELSRLECTCWRVANASSRKWAKDVACSARASTNDDCISTSDVCASYDSCAFVSTATDESPKVRQIHPKSELAVSWSM